uniref:Predicted protein n=1 Tax=Hordeum vulgare subsp. vulgare TaxID=112509 RepID=F2DHB2_HORVV|nr:predicted protein [Hordeum vulgare subsp. vulgare]
MLTLTFLPFEQLVMLAQSPLIYIGILCCEFELLCAICCSAILSLR